MEQFINKNKYAVSNAFIIIFMMILREGVALVKPDKRMLFNAFIGYFLQHIKY